MARNVWLMPYSNFQKSHFNASWGLAYAVAKSLREDASGEYACRIKRVGVNIYDADEAVNEAEFQDQSPSSLDIVIAFGEGGPDDLFNFEHTADASRNSIPDQYDLYGRPIPEILAYGPKLNGAVAGWYSNDDVRRLVRKFDNKAGQQQESPGAGDYLCGYMTEKLATSHVLSTKGFFIHTRSYDPKKSSEDRDRAGKIIAEFIEAFCSL